MKSAASSPRARAAARRPAHIPGDHGGRQGRVRPNRRNRPPRQKVDEAVKQQQDLLAEFEKIADELNRVLASLEGSTLLKRLKAASRLQYKIGGRLNEQVVGGLRR